MAESDLTAARVRQVFDYNPETGEFYRKMDRMGRQIPPHKVGMTLPMGYIYISIDTKLVRAHRLAWLYMTGAWPELHIDHINGVKDDNRFCNLRHVSPRTNAENRRRPKATATSGYMGVSRDRALWRAVIRIDGKQKHIGTFKTPEDAAEAYLRAKRDLHEGCTI